MILWLTIVCILAQAGLDAADVDLTGPEAAPSPAVQSLEEARLQDAVVRGLDLLGGPAQSRTGGGLSALDTVPRDAAPRLAGRMETSSDPETRVRAVETLDTTGGELVDDLFRALADPVPRVSETAALRLAKADPETVAARVLEVFDTGGATEVHALDTQLHLLRGVLEARMLALLEDTDAPVRRRRIAAYTLGRMGVADAAGLLARAAWEENDDLALTCCRALAQLRGPQSTSLWIELLAHGLGAVRAMAVDALAAYGGPEAMNALVACAQGSSDAYQARQAARALTVWPLEQAAPALLQLLHAGNPELAGVAGQQLRSMTGLQLPNDPEAWARWYADFREGRWPPAPPPPDPAGPPIGLEFME